MEFGLVHHIEYYVHDLVSSKEFWGWFLERIGYSLYQEFDDGFSFRHNTGTYLVFVKVDKEFLDIKNNRRGSGLNHIAFMGKDEAYLDELQKELELRRIKILKRNKKYLCFEDSNDFAVEVYAE